MLAELRKKIRQFWKRRKREYELLFELALSSDLSEDVDPCLFWRQHAYKFPRLAVIARSLLAIPPSSIDSERLFSTVGLITANTRRSRISAATLKKLIFIAAFCQREKLRFNDIAEFGQFSDELSAVESCAASSYVD
ncbi:hypothetical protein PRIPAC_71904 [Pristionchus pacificus]|uniref:Dimer_Tnp_hAT domain-containing protein n=1 Tax=Pristionchus pacificus TaxID=54126 RepID=A0A2A6B4D8_PRIPA|nr:hypothetical protein PRIPAC_71904 [Pristionchus pacificus]|eukprot:PDM60739.1 hypothetical protein PRIPAC_54545 [Pristionchus pacificus]